MTNTALRGAAAAALFFIAPTIASAQSAERPKSHAVPVTNAPVVDGALDEDDWMSAPPLTGFVQRVPSDGQPASERTEVRILYD